MAILNSLGVNNTIWLQMACFLVAYLALTQLVFKPYLAAFQERHKRTAGNEEYADRVIEESRQIQARIETRARELNVQHRDIFDKSRGEAQREYENIISRARSEATLLAAKNSELIEQQLKQAREELSRQMPAVSREIASKLVGQDWNQ